MQNFKIPISLRRAFLGRRKGEERPPAIVEWIEALIWALVVTTIIKFLLIQAYRIPTGSMEETLLVGDFLFVIKTTYGYNIPFTKIKILKGRDPRRGEIVVFRNPKDNRPFVKRCIGLPGDTVEIRHKELYINGEKQTEYYVIHRDPYEYPGVEGVSMEDYQSLWEKGELGRNFGIFCRDNFGPVIVPPGYILVLGDNRDNSHDSRFWGPLDINLLMGKPLFIYWSWRPDVPIWNITKKVRWKRIGKIIKD